MNDVTIFDFSNDWEVLVFAFQCSCPLLPERVGHILRFNHADTIKSFKFFFFQAEDGIRDRDVTGVQTCALRSSSGTSSSRRGATGAPSGTACWRSTRS